MSATSSQHYAAHIADQSRPFPGLEGALDELAGDGCRLIVCTNKLEWLSRRLLDALGLCKRFDVVCGADTFGLQKPDPEIPATHASRAGRRPSGARRAWSGTRPTMSICARAAGIPVVAVDFGYTETPVSRIAG